jgi:hypothetical protein
MESRRAEVRDREWMRRGISMTPSGPEDVISSGCLPYAWRDTEHQRKEGETTGRKSRTGDRGRSLSCSSLPGSSIHSHEQEQTVPTWNVPSADYLSCRSAGASANECKTDAIPEGS